MTKLKTLINPPLTQAIQRQTAADAAAPEPLQQPVHEQPPAASEQADTQQPALGHPVILWQPTLAVVPQRQPTLANAGLPQEGERCLLHISVCITFACTSALALQSVLVVMRYQMATSSLFCAALGEQVTGDQPRTESLFDAWQRCVQAA